MQFWMVKYMQQEVKLKNMELSFHITRSQVVGFIVLGGSNSWNA